MRLDVETADGLEQVTPAGIVNIYQKQIERHVTSIRESDYSHGADALHNLRMLFACHKSASAGSQFIKV